MYEEGCSDLLRELLKLNSEEASLQFKLFELLEAAKIETIRLSGLAAECSFYDVKRAEEIRQRMEHFFRKYVNLRR